MPFERSDGVVSVRRYEIGDARGVFEAASESIDAIYPWMEWCHPGYAFEEAEEWVGHAATAGESGTSEFPMVVVAAGSGQILGSSGLNKIDPLHRIANLGYWIRTSAEGRGFATRATALAAVVGFTKLDLRRLEIVAVLDNVASRRVAEKVGATFEGVKRHGLFLHGRSHDAALYSLTRDDLPALEATISS